MDTASPPHAPSYYAATATPAPTRPRLADRIRVDVAVLGGGCTGLSTALELAERGVRVALVEGVRIGWGASGRNGGQVLPGLTADAAKIAQRFGADFARDLYALTLDAVGLVEERTRRHAIACDLTPGFVYTALTERQETLLQAEPAFMATTYGHHGLEWWDRDRLAAAVRSPRYRGGLYDPCARHLHPLNFCLGLAAAAETAGVRLFERSPVTALEDGSTGEGRAALITADGRIDADWIVLAGDAYLERVAPRVERLQAPVISAIVATEPLSADQMAACLPQRLAVCDANFVMDYFRPSADGRILFGGLARYDGREPRAPIHALAPRLERVFPQLRGVGFDFAWTGRVGVSRDRMPQIGRAGPRALFAQGYSGHGLAFSMMAGRVLAQAITGDRAWLERFDRLPRPSLPGPPLRAPAMIAATWFYRLRDMIGF